MLGLIRSVPGTKRTRSARFYINVTYPISFSIEMVTAPAPSVVATGNATVKSKTMSNGLKQLSGSSIIPHLSCTGRYVNICFDIGGVLLKPNLDVSHGTALHPILFKRMIRSHAWHQYQEGKLPWLQTRHQLAQQLDEDHAAAEADIQTFVDRARASLAPVAEIVELIEALSATQSKKLRLYCMTNAAKEDYDYIVAAFPDLFQKFDAIFYSAAVGIRKPSFGAFQHFLHATQCQASETIFVDDTVQNVVAADVLGFTAILVKDTESVVDLLVYHLRTEEERLAAAWEFLHRKKGGASLTSEGVRVQILYDQFLIAGLLDDPSFLPMQKAPETGVFNFFHPHEQRRQAKASTNAATHSTLPDDLDTTAMALTVLHKFGKVDMAVINTALDKMLESVTEDGLFPVYFDPLRPRTDYVIQVVICLLFHLAGRVEPVRKVEEILYKVLKSRVYLEGSMYYPTPEVFLLHLARLRSMNSSSLEPEFVSLLEKRVRERVGLPGDALALAARLLACDYCGIPNGRDRKQLARMQRVDGSWELCTFYTYNDPKSWIANEVTTTALAVAALQTQTLTHAH